MRKLLLFLFLFLSFYFQHAQNFMGLANSNYAGVFGMDLQPASIADNRLKFDINLAGASGSFFNDYLDIKSSLLLGNTVDWETLSNAADGRSFFPERLNGESKFLYVQQDVHLPSVMISLGKKSSIGFTSRIRTFVNVDNISEILARQLYFEINEPDFWGTVYNNDGLQGSVMNYMELGLNYARVLVDNEKHFLKGGARLKRLIGGGAFYFRAETLDFEFDRDSLMSAYNVNAEYGHSPNIGLRANDILDALSVSDLLAESNRGWGIDLGFVYEYRPNHERYNYGVGKYREPRRDRNKYKFRIGVSLLDVGGITFPKAPTSGDFTGDMIDYSVNRLIPNGALDVDAIIASNFDINDVQETEFYMPLPTAASFQFDYRIGEHWAVNFTPFWGFRRENVAQRVRMINNNSLSVRWEGKWFGLTVPVSFSSERETSMGLMAKVGPLIVGSDNIISLTQGEFSRGANVYAALRFGIPYGKPKDEDFDGVPDFYDQCPEIAGIESLDGCRERFDDTQIPLIAVNLETPTPPEYTFYVAKADKLDLAQLRAKVASVQPPPPPPIAIEQKPVVTPVPVVIASKEEVPVKEEIPVLAETVEKKPVVDPLIPKPEPKKEEPAKIEPVKTEPVKTEPVKTEPVKTEPVKTEPVKTEPIKTEPIKTEPIKTEPIKTEPVKPEIPKPAPRTTMQLAEVSLAWAPRLGMPELEKESVQLRQLKLKQLRMPPKPAELEPFVPIYSRGEMLKLMPYADLDKDGVPNIDDDCPDIPGDILNEGCPEVEEGFFKEDVFKSLYFDLGEFGLRPKSQRVLQEVAAYLKENTDAGVILAGHTDNSGTERANVGLSDRRANKAQDYLISLGVKSSQIAAFYYGEGLPAAANKTPAGKQLNRRVDVSFRARN